MYFVDLGMRNALVNDFRGLEFREDVGALWENFVMVERLKKNQLEQKYVRSYYWRSRDKQEVDLVEEFGTTTSAYECKWSKSSKPPGGFVSEHPNIGVEFITKTNYWDYL